MHRKEFVRHVGHLPRITAMNVTHCWWRTSRCTVGLVNAGYSTSHSNGIERRGRLVKICQGCFRPYSNSEFVMLLAAWCRWNSAVI